MSIVINVTLALPVDDTTVYTTLSLAKLTKNTTMTNYYTRVINFTIVDFGRGG